MTSAPASVTTGGVLPPLSVVTQPAPRSSSLLTSSWDLPEGRLDEHLEDRVVRLNGLVELAQEVLQRGPCRRHVGSAESRGATQRVLRGLDPRTPFGLLLLARHQLASPALSRSRSCAMAAS